MADAPGTETITSADGARIAYRTLGTGPPVVVVHGGLGSSLSWLSVARRLAGELSFLL